MTEAYRSKIYPGRVFHHRLRPKPHKLNYRVFTLLLDLDELPRLDHDLRLFAHNRFAVFSFYDRDHGAGENGDLRTYVRAALQQADINISDGKIKLLCYPRIFGYVFNPLSVYYCYDGDDHLRAMLYEVSNTFGERHSYLMEINEHQGLKARQHCKKRFHVSPFMAVSGVYEFKLRLTDKLILVRIDLSDDSGLLMRTGFAGSAEVLSGQNLFKMLILYPLMTVKVIIGIHWEALKLWSKGLHVFTKPEPPAQSFSGGRDSSNQTDGPV